MGDFDGAAAEGGVTGSRGATVEVISFHPGVNQAERVMNTELARALLLKEALADEMLDNARHKTRAGFGVLDKFTLRPNTVTVSEQTANNSSAFSDEDITGFKLKTKIPARQIATVNEQPFGSQIYPAIQINRCQPLLATKIQNAGDQLGGNQQ